jgi:hypothetical protein
MFTPLLSAIIQSSDTTKFKMMMNRYGFRFWSSVAVKTVSKTAEPSVVSWQLFSPSSS